MGAWSAGRRAASAVLIVASVGLAAVLTAGGAGAAARSAPVATITDNCSAEGVDVDLVNDGDGEIEFVVEADYPVGAYQAQKVLLDGGGEEHVAIPITEGATVTVTVTIDETVIATKTITRECQQATTSTSEATTTSPTSTALASTTTAGCADSCTEVGGTKTTRDLPATGSSSGLLAAIAGLLLLTGGLLLAVPARTRHRHRRSNSA
jgi:LPXTG-motif cell wall-anchored protein